MRCIPLSEFRCKEVICLDSGKRLGYISNLELDLSCGKVVALLLPGPKKLRGFWTQVEYRVPWCEIASIGSDLILVNRCEQFCRERGKEKN